MPRQRRRPSETATTSEHTDAPPPVAAPGEDEVRKLLDRATPRKVKVAQVRANDWNYKPMTEEELAKEIASIRKHGFVVPTVVRSAVPGKGPLGFYEILDGEHRWRALQALGVKEIHVMDLGEASDVEAKELTVVLNELHGSPQFDALGSLLQSIAEDTSVDEMLRTMPFPEDELRALINLPDDPLKEYGSKAAPATGISPTKDWTTLKFRVPPGAKEIIEGAISAALGTETIRAPKDVKEGMGLERVCRSYLGEAEGTEEDLGPVEPPADGGGSDDLPGRLPVDEPSGPSIPADELAV